MIVYVYNRTLCDGCIIQGYPFTPFMTKITFTWCPNCKAGHDHEDLLITTKFHAKERAHRGSGAWVMLKCKECGVKHSAGFKMFGN